MDDDEARLPDGLPGLGRGAHRDATREACVMEYAALLGGGHHTDRPSRVDPLLAQLCRTTNDLVGDEARRDLLRLVPALIGTAAPGTGAADGDDAVLRAVARVLGAEHEVDRAIALGEPDDDPGTGGGTAVLDRPLRTPRSRVGWRRVRREDLAYSVVVHRHMGRLGTRLDDREGVDLLEALVHAVRAARGLPAVSTAAVWPRPADVAAELGDGQGRGLRAARRP